MLTEGGDDGWIYIVQAGPKKRRLREIMRFLGNMSGIVVITVMTVLTWV